ncbi:acyl-ACP--UDP-N-acetylglucosamine O-acyltransferase [Paracoccus suum]|uniref:Acyl-[acyl-carrier-protein]--UDP-N-acetylglucosamine O-acyltransferase n=1 Tax=Paracoccus suum TaxID=2259340 RepID=A0A344PL50_9RHOB|nr:acyl-ACP--UDP-N-acetylglucosamine O-acyltransferase [Paracoccus suum]AXC50105.1 acyl-ACP--UDP-N-acetylglucosamine O-acyltransferase [Paracoccus suum]
MADTRIHPTSVIAPGAEIGVGAEVGPFCVIGPEVVLHDGAVLKSHVVVSGQTEIGPGTVIFPFASIGEAPQDLKFRGERTRLVIGARNRIREHVTMNPGTEGGGGETRVGDDGLYMTGCHVAHDCQVGDRVVLVNHVALAGHVSIGDDVVVGGLSGVHQFVRIGQGAMIGALSMVTADVIPFGLVQGPRARLDGLNIIGLKRHGASRSELSALRAMLAALGHGPFREAARGLAGQPDAGPRERAILDFILGPSERSFLTPLGGAE